MSRFFIDRPIFAWVVAIILMLVGVMCITRLPITPYPTIAPPSIAISAVYPGASAKTVEDSVTQVIEQNMNGLDGLIYMASSSTASGGVGITLTFASGTNPDIAQVQVQNRLQAVTPLLPQIVQQQGINVSKTNSSFLMAVGFYSADGSMTANDMSDYMSSTVLDRVQRVPGVGGTEMFGSKYALRIWLDPGKLRAYSLTPTDVVNAITAQNGQFSVGQLGGAPAVKDQQINATITARGRLQTPEQFQNIILRGASTGAVLKLKDVARVEMGADSYDFSVVYNGRPSTGFGILLASGANALDTANNVRALIKELQPGFPRGLKAFVPFDTTPYVRVSIHEVIKTLVEAIVLVFLVMYLFLQNLRATLIPTIAVPVVLLGTFPVLLVAGFSINMLTMFAVVLAIGLLVDDAIVVVENVERLMSEEGLSPVEATRKSMGQITGALVGIGTVLAAVFLPMAFLNGSTGVIYRQFSITIVSAMILSVFVAVTLTPALCATLLRPVGAKGHDNHLRFFGWFNRKFNETNVRYQGWVHNILRRGGRYMIVYTCLAALMGFAFVRLPTSFLPDEDQGYLFVLLQTPVGATQERTNHALDQVQQYFAQAEKNTVDTVFTVQGFSFSGSGQNAGIGFVLLKDWDLRKRKDQSVTAIAGRAYFALSRVKDALIYPVAPPPVTELGTSTGFDFYLKDEGNQGHAALIAARNQLLGMASQDKLLTGVRPNGSEDSPQFRLDIDADKASALGVSLADVNNTLAVAWGGRYMDDFIDRGRVKRVYIQADAPYRMNPEDFNRWYVRSGTGQMVPVSTFTSSHWEYGSPELHRYNGVSAVEISGQAAEGISSGTAMAEIEKLVARLPIGFRIEWTGQSYQERAAGSQTPLLYTLSLIVVFLALAALYESWTIPIPILLAVPLGIIGAVFATAVRGYERDIYFQVAMLTTIGLASKNAILIIEFAKLNLDAGMDLITATLHAVRDRLRPILMTSLAFGFGVLPLAVAKGAGAGAQRAIGTGVFGGMLAGTLLGVFFVPLLFVFMQRLFGRIRHEEQPKL
ncbi:MAG TPA: efflux RND transporter permease subunit [Steroidobacteraceae bacterium]|nr:efflux RND transporter permease subunit [Steroidobacteraceae bacterium]